MKNKKKAIVEDDFDSPLITKKSKPAIDFSELEVKEEKPNNKVNIKHNDVEKNKSKPPKQKSVNNAQNEIRNLKTKIQLYKTHFASETENISVDALDEMNKEELQEKLNEMKSTVAAADPSSLITMMYHTSIGLTEQLSAFTPLKLQGLSVATQNNPSIKKALIELEIEYGDFGYLPSPEKKLLLLTLQNIYAVHKYNSNQQFREAIDRAAQNAANNPITEKFVDI